MTGLMSDIERKTCWSPAGHAGHSGPDAMQRLLRSARWDEDLVRDEVRDLVPEHLGRQDGVVIVDGTGVLKKGLHSAGVQRQYTGTAGRIDNPQRQSRRQGTTPLPVGVDRPGRRRQPSPTARPSHPDQR
ncbi:transposase [Streptomyces hygroscopicus]|uniref:transposase n=1 Tax=Streptomyces hygroscopicus TaxID=1912 RepID=UPI0036355DD8